MNTRIIVDSTADLLPELKPEFSVVPLTVHFGDEEYLDGVDITHKQFYEKLIESDVLPTTSQPTPDAFAQLYRQVTGAGEQAVVITISQKLSGTYQSAMIAAAAYPNCVYVVDSKNAAIGAAILAELALRLAKEGMPAADIAQRLTLERENIRLIALVDTLEYLHRGGRLSKTAAIAGGILAIKPVICLRDGEIAVLGKARGSKKANNLLVKEIEAAGGVDFSKPLLLGYTGLTDVMLKKYIEDSAALWEGHASAIRTTPIGSVIGTHAGPGAVAAAFFKK